MQLGIGCSLKIQENADLFFENSGKIFCVL
jgi:hypothetical protein